MKCLQGIDVSSWQFDLDLTRVPCDFLIAKATEGTRCKDPYFEYFMDTSIDMKKCIGAYHVSTKGDPCEQANYFVETVSRYINRALLVLDLEVFEYPEYGGLYDFFDFKFMKSGEGVEWVEIWLERVYELTGVRPGIFMQKWVSRNYTWSHISENTFLWIGQNAEFPYASYTNYPWTDKLGTGCFKQYLLHQYTCTDQFPSYSGHINLDIFYGDILDWSNFATNQN